jgi:hypothetical protein
MIQKQRFVVAIAGVVSNPHGPPSAAIKWMIKLQFSNKTIVGEVPPSTGSDIISPLVGTQGRTLTLKTERYWPGTSLQPITAGGAVEGWLLAIFKDVSVEDVYASKPTLVLSCADVVSEKRHELKVKLGETRGFHIPGD